MKRAEQKLENCWNLKDLYENEEKWQEDFDSLEKSLPELSAHVANMSESADKLLAFLLFQDKCSILAERLYVYATQKSHEDTANAVYQNLSSKASSLLIKMNAASAAFSPMLLEMGKEKVMAYMAQVPDLEKYHRFLFEYFRKEKHILSHEMEEMLANVREVAEGASDIFSMFNNADVAFDEIENEQGGKMPLTHGNFIVYMENQNRNVRKAAFESLYKQYKKFENTLAAAYFANVKQDVFFAKARKYENSLAYGLDDANIPVIVCKQLIETVHKYLPLMYRYVGLRKKELGLDEPHMYDIYVPIVSRSERKIPFEEAKEIVKQGLKPLGEEYLSLLQEGFDNRWIDVYENEGKRSGAYSWGAYGVHPYVLLNYQENLNNVFTLAHEMGHALHSYYSDREQSYVDAGYKIFVAEVASTCNESLLIHHLLKECSEAEEKKYLINYFMDQFRGTLFRQTMFAEFEMLAHQMAEEGQSLTAETLSAMYYDLNRKYFGDEIVLDEQIASEWARIPHFYRSFYVYQYATGFSAAIAISRKILNGDEATLNGYMKFLQSGCSMDPIDLLKLADVDMTRAEPIEEAMKLFESLLDQYESIQ